MITECSEEKKKRIRWGKLRRIEPTNFLLPEGERVKDVSTVVGRKTREALKPSPTTLCFPPLFPTGSSLFYIFAVFLRGGGLKDFFVLLAEVIFFWFIFFTFSGRATVVAIFQSPRDHGKKEGKLKVTEEGKKEEEEEKW